MVPNIGRIGNDGFESFLGWAENKISYFYFGIFSENTCLPRLGNNFRVYIRPIKLLFRSNFFQGSIKCPPAYSRIKNHICIPRNICHHGLRYPFGGPKLAFAAQFFSFGPFGR